MLLACYRSRAAFQALEKFDSKYSLFAGQGLTWLCFRQVREPLELLVR
jgi:hypothetical protein